MAADVEVPQDNPCCVAWKKKHAKLMEKCSRLEELKNRFRECTTLVQQKYDVIEKENGGFRQAMAELEEQVSRWKDEKEKESAIRIDLEDEVSALKDEIQLLKRSGNSASQQADGLLQERLDAAEGEIKQMNELLVKERGRADLEKKNAEMERKKAEATLKKVQMETNKVLEAQGVITMERKKAEEDGLLLEKLKKETEALKSMLDSERSKSESAEKKLEMEKQKNIREKKKAESAVAKAEEQRKLAETNLKKAEESKLLYEKLKREAETGVVNVERKKAEEDRLLLEKLKNETDVLKSMLDSERSKSESADKKLEMEKQKTIREKKKAESAVTKAVEQRKVAEANLKKAEERKLLCEKLKMEADAVKSMLTSERSKHEAAEKKVEAEKQKTTREKKRADLVVANAEEQRALAETNLKKARLEKDRADNLYRELEEERNRAEKLDRELRELKFPGKLAEAHVDPSIPRKFAELTSDVCTEMVMSDVSQWVKLLLEKEQEIVRERKRTDSEKKKAKRESKVAEEYRKMAREVKHQADHLSKELEGYKLKFKELWEELQELLAYKRNADGPRSCNNITSDSDTVKLLKKQLKLEKMLANHAQKATEVEIVRNSMLGHELYHLKQDVVRFQQRLNILDDSILYDGEGILELEKMGNQTFAREKFHADAYHGQLTSGIDSRLDPPCSGFKRKFSLSSAINSSSTSRSLVGSPGRGNLSEMTSAELGEDISRSSDKQRMTCNENTVFKDKNSIGSPSRGNPYGKKGYCCDNRSILDAVESVESFYSKGQKLQQRVLSQLHAIVNGQKEEAAKENLLESSCEKLVRPPKRRKISYEGAVVTHTFHESGEQIVLSIDDVDAGMQVSPPAVDGTRFDQRPTDGRDNILEGLPRDFDHMEIRSYMKLLDLDNPADEESYRRAIEAPLSPTLPEIEFHRNDALEADHFKMLVGGSFQEGPSAVKNTLPPKSSFNNLNIEKNPTNLLSDDLVSSESQMEECSVDLSKKASFGKPSNASCYQILVSGEKLGVSDIHGSEKEETNLLCARRVDSTAGGLLKYLVISSDNKDSHSILRILKTISNCMHQSSLLHSVDIFIQNLLFTILNAEDLSTKERACVFFTITLPRISEVGGESLTNVLGGDLVQSIGSIILEIRSALSDLKLRKKFMEAFDVYELLALIEDFLLQRKVLVCADVSAGTQSFCGPKVNLVLNGNLILLSELAASAHQVGAASSLLASLCSAFDHIGFLCETSCNIFTTQKFDPEVVLAVLHAFADTCGSKYFSLQQYNLPMTVVKSFVICLEKQMPSSNSKCWPCCSNCPFSEGALPIKDLASMLLLKLRMYGQSVSRTQGSHDEDLLRFTDILSLIEILATFMGWDWTNDNIIGQFRELLESCEAEGFVAAIIVLLGQLGRLGVDARGCEHVGIKKLSELFSAFLNQSTFSESSLSMQIATVTALLGLTPIKFKDIIETPDFMNGSVHANFIRKWFSLLNNEQQSAFRLQQAASETNCRIGFL